MGSDSLRSEGAFVGQLADHARVLQHEARAAIARGDYARAAALIDDAELLAEDVHDLVDDLEDRDTGRLMALAAKREAASASASAAPRSPARSPRTLRMAIGASLAMSLALVEC